MFEHESEKSVFRFAGSFFPSCTLIFYGTFEFPNTSQSIESVWKRAFSRLLRKLAKIIPSTLAAGASNWSFSQRTQISYFYGSFLKVSQCRNTFKNFKLFLETPIKILHPNNIIHHEISSQCFLNFESEKISQSLVFSVLFKKSLIAKSVRVL